MFDPQTRFPVPHNIVPLFPTHLMYTYDVELYYHCHATQRFCRLRRMCNIMWIVFRVWAGYGGGGAVRRCGDSIV